MQVAGLIGDPVAHSLSPYLHDAAFRAAGLDARYELWPTPLADLPGRVDALRRPCILGANVTVPHKQAVIPLLDEISETARRIGAVNTVIPRGEHLIGENTDAYGFARTLADVGGQAGPRSALVVGAGGAARAVLVSLQDAGIERITLVNRTRQRAEALSTSLKLDGIPDIGVEVWTALESCAGNADLLVNATSIGWHGDERPFEEAVIAALPDGAVVIDLTYRATAMLLQAAARGLRTGDGLPMLIYQGARAFELWTGQPAPVAVMTGAVRDEQTRRA